MYKKIFGAAVLAIALICSRSALADNSLCHQELQTLVESIKLSSDQKTKIQPIIDQMKKTMKDDGMQIDALKPQIKALVRTTPMDQDKLNALVDKKSELIGDMMKAHLNAENLIFAILTADQKASLGKLMDDAEAKMAAKYKSCHQD